MGRWEDGTNPWRAAAQLSQHSAPSKAPPAWSFHAPFSSSLDRMGKPSDYAYLQSASSEGLIISHGTPFFSPSLQLLLVFSAPGWACCMPALIKANASHKFPAFRLWHYASSRAAAVLLEIFCRPATGSPGNTSNVVGSRREGHCCSTRCTA